MFAPDVFVHFGPDWLTVGRAEKLSCDLLQEVSLPYSCHNLCLCLPEFVNVWGRVLTQVLQTPVMSLWLLAASVFWCFSVFSRYLRLLYDFFFFILPESFDLTHLAFSHETVVANK